MVGLVGNPAVHDANVPLPPKLTSLPPELVGVFPLLFQVVSAFALKPFIRKKPLALGTRARNEAMDDTLRVMELDATFAQIAFVSLALVAERMMIPYVEVAPMVTLLPVTVAPRVL